MIETANAGERSYARADVHVHSKYSDRPSEWFLRRIGAPECFVEPARIYQAAKERGFDFVTISDHNRIQGALDIAHHPDVFISVEVTTYFPEDGAKIHMLALGITEAQFAMIQELRPNIYELQRYCLAEGIVTSVAHPLFRVNDRITVRHVEKLLLLFNRFEGINGTRDRRACELVNDIFRYLTPPLMERMANRHDIEPVGPRPWLKTFTGGSDDHSGLYLGHAFTMTPIARTPAEFIEHLRSGDHEMGGDHGTSSLLAHCFYEITYSYYDRILRPHTASSNHPLLGQLLTSMLDAPKPAPDYSFLGSRVRNLVGRFYTARRMRHLSPAERVVVQELREIFSHTPDPVEADPRQDRIVFERASRLSQTIGYAFLCRFEKHLREGRLLESIQSLASLAPVALAIAPYLTSYSTQRKDDGFLRQVASAFPSPVARVHRSDRRAWITDSFSDVNGVAVVVQKLGAEARRSHLPLTVLTCEERTVEVDADVVNFKPLGTFDVPEYPGQRVAFPPFLEVLDHIERMNYRELIISTPGPMGWLGLAAARLLGLRTIGVYHTDIPAYVRHYTQDPSLEEFAWRFVQAFYGSVDEIVVPSQTYRRQLIQRGFEAGSIHVVEHGVDLQQFHPQRREEQYFRRQGLPPGFTFLYTGRVSKEKNLDMLVEAFLALLGAGHQANLAIVGDGPYAGELRRRFRHARVAFLGYRHGVDLATAYASADAFVFPSTTDTFGNVVLEAHASGLPVIVTDRGGPQDIVARSNGGIIVNAADATAFQAAMLQLMSDDATRATLRARGLAHACGAGWPDALRSLWAIGDRLIEVPVDGAVKVEVPTAEMLEFS
jgi:glycosyltransferase involved in cell wall biosynthesis